MKLHLSVLIVGYNGEKYLKKGYLDSVIDACGFLNKVDTKIIFLDNASTDSTRDIVSERYPEIDLIGCLENTYYCEGNNIAIKYAYKEYHSDYFVLIDQDQKVENDFLQEHLKLMYKNRKIGLAQSLTKRMEKPELIYSSGSSFRDNGEGFPIAEVPQTNGNFVERESCSILAAIIRTTALEKIGLFDEIFKNYYEGGDLSFRLRKGDYVCGCNLMSTSYHEGSFYNKGFNRHIFYFTTRNKPIFWAKHSMEMYKTVKEDYTKRLEKIEKEQSLSNFIINEKQETLRRGIVDGLWISEEILKLPRKEIDIRDYNMNSFIMVRKNGVDYRSVGDYR